jgi:hypothetical protein
MDGPGQTDRVARRGRCCGQTYNNPASHWQPGSRGQTAWQTEIQTDTPCGVSVRLMPTMNPPQAPGPLSLSTGGTWPLRDRAACHAHCVTPNLGGQTTELGHCRKEKNRAQGCAYVCGHKMSRGFRRRRRRRLSFQVRTGTFGPSQARRDSDIDSESETRQPEQREDFQYSS